MLAIIEDNQFIYLDQMAVSIEEVLIKRFRAKDPKSRYSNATAWDGWYKRYNTRKQRLALPFLEELKLCCKQNNIPLEIDDRRPAPKYLVPPKGGIGKDYLAGVTLEDYQVDSLHACCDHEIGQISAPTGSGKTELLCGLVKMFGCPTMIITEQIIVLEQIVKRLSLRGVVKKEDVGLFCYGHMPEKDNLVMVGSIQSLSTPTPIDRDSIKMSKIRAIRMYKEWKKGNNDYLKKLPKDILKLKNINDIDSPLLELLMSLCEDVEWERLKKWYRTRKKKAAAIQKIIGKCDLLLVDECVHEDTWISTNRGLMQAKNVVKILKDNEKIYARVGGSFYKIEQYAIIRKKQIKITTNTGRELCCSGNHRIMVYDDGRCKTKFANNLVPGDVLLSSCPDVEINHSDLDFKKWYYLGLFIGDGHFLNNKQVKYGVRKDKSSWHAIMKDMQKVWPGDYIMKDNNRGDLVIRIKSPRFIKWLKILGFHVGRKLGRIEFDNIIDNYNAAAGFLSGLFDAEGTAYSYHAKFGCTDLIIVKLVQIALSYLGITGYFTLENKRTSKRNASWRVNIYGHDYVKFRKHVGFRFSRKNERTQGYQPVCDSNRNIDPKAIIKKWLATGITNKALATVIDEKCHVLYNKKINAQRLMKWHNNIQSLNINNIKSYGQARNFLGVSDKKVAKFHNIAVMTAWKRRRRRKHDNWVPLAESIIDKLKDIKIDDITNFNTEKVRNIKNINEEASLIDFTIESKKMFEANGLLVHNCDLCSSQQYARLFKNYFNGRRKYGVTGTPYDKDKPIQMLFVKEHVGNVIYEVKRQEVQDAGRIIPIKYYSFIVGADGDRQDSRAYDIAVREEIVENTKFHNFVAKVVSAFSNDRTLILIGTSPIEPFGLALEEIIPNSRFIFGKTSKKARREQLKLFEEGKLQCLIGSLIFKRGLDLSGGVDNLVIIGGGAKHSEYNQRVGRAVRLNEKGTARVFGFFFLSNKYLYKHSRANLKAVVEMGYPARVVFGGKTIDGEKFIKTRYRLPKF